MYFQNYDYAVRRGAKKMYQALPSSPTSKILKSNRILEEYISIQPLCVVFLSSFKINRITVYVSLLKNMACTTANRLLFFV